MPKIVVRVSYKSIISFVENCNFKQIETTPEISQLLVKNINKQFVMSSITYSGNYHGIKIFTNNLIYKGFAKTLNCSVLFADSTRKFYHKRLERWKF